MWTTLKVYKSRQLIQSQSCDLSEKGRQKMEDDSDQYSPSMNSKEHSKSSHKSKRSNSKHRHRKHKSRSKNSKKDKHSVESQDKMSTQRVSQQKNSKSLAEVMEEQPKPLTEPSEVSIAPSQPNQSIDKEDQIKMEQQSASHLESVSSMDSVKSLDQAKDPKSESARKADERRIRRNQRRKEKRRKLRIEKLRAQGKEIPQQSIKIEGDSVKQEFEQYDSNESRPTIYDSNPFKPTEEDLKNGLRLIKRVLPECSLYSTIVKLKQAITRRYDPAPEPTQQQQQHMPVISHKLPDMNEPTQQELDELRESLMNEPDFNMDEQEQLPEIDPNELVNFKPEGMAAWERGVNPFHRKRQIDRANMYKLPEDKESDRSGSIYYGDEQSQKPPQ